MSGYFINNNKLDQMFYFTGLSDFLVDDMKGTNLIQRTNDVSLNVVNIAPPYSMYKKNGLDICNNLVYKYVEVTSTQTVSIPDWCTHISAILIGGGGGGGGGGGPVQYNTTYKKYGGGGGGGGSGYISILNTYIVGADRTLTVTIGSGGSGGSGGTNLSGSVGLAGSGTSGTSASRSSISIGFSIGLSVILSADGGNYGEFGKGGRVPAIVSNIVSGAGGAGGSGEVGGGAGGSNFGAPGMSGKAKLDKCFLSGSNMITQNLYGSGGNGGTGHTNESYTSPGSPGSDGSPGYARIYFLKLFSSITGGYSLSNTTYNGTTYNVMTFTGDGTFTPIPDITVKYMLIVGGGGSSGKNPLTYEYYNELGGGGGGAVGIYNFTEPTSNPFKLLGGKQYSITVGLGGGTGGMFGSKGQGYNTVLTNGDFTETAYGGGYGGSNGNDTYDASEGRNNGIIYGSGGGAARYGQKATVPYNSIVKLPTGIKYYFGSGQDSSIDGGAGGSANVQFIDDLYYGRGGKQSLSIGNNNGYGGRDGGNGNSGIVKIYYV